MTTPITKTDIESELKVTFSSQYTDAYFTDLINYAQASLEGATNRVTFTGSSTYLAKMAQICAAIDWLSMFDRDLLKSAISSISENGASISFSNGKTLESYRDTFDILTKRLAIPHYTNHNITMTDIDSTHTGLEGSTLY